MRGMVAAVLRARRAAWSIPTTNAGMPILYEKPAEVGADRIANSIAAYERYGQAQRSAAHHRGSRHGDDLRRGHGEGRVSRRCHLPGSADRRRRAVSARGATAARRRAQAGDASSVGRRSARSSRACSTATSAWSKGLIAPDDRRARRRGDVHRDRWARAARSCRRRRSSTRVEPDITLHGLRIVWERKPDVDVADSAAQIETYLCQKNDGHLIRIVRSVVRARLVAGRPRVCRSRSRVAGIDRYFERYYAKGSATSAGPDRFLRRRRARCVRRVAPRRGGRTPGGRVPSHRWKR